MPENTTMGRLNLETQDKIGSIRSMAEKRILCVGLCCVDIFNICKEYPKEDSDQRIIDHYRQRGGNASNTCSVLSLLGSKCELLATIAKSKEYYSFQRQDLEDYGIVSKNCVVHQNCATPVSTVIINAQNGSRTIMLYRKNLPELTFEDFERIGLKESNQYKWVHIETRPAYPAIKKMLEYMWECNKLLSDDERIKISMELEKPDRSKFCDLIHLVDVLFVSKDFAKAGGYQDMVSTVKGFKENCRKETSVICAWGEMGAAAIDPDSNIFQSPSFPPEQIVDTLGAGDTFNGAVLHSLADNHSSLKEAITFGCQVAGAKVGIRGFKDLCKFRNGHNF